MARGLFAANGNLDERIAEPANDREGPGVFFCAEHRFHLTDKSLGRQGSVVRRAAKTFLISCAADSTFASEVVTPEERAGTTCGFTVSSCCTCASSPRSSNCKRQRCGVSRDSHQSSSVPISVKLALRRIVRYTSRIFLPYRNKVTSGG